MKLKTLVDQLEIVAMNADPETEVRGISYDSRKTEEGDLFVAIRGFETDGHRFIPKAIEKKAAVILCEIPPEQDVPYIQVADSRLALAKCSAVFYGFPATSMRMIGVTGTSGKTTVSTLLKHVLEETIGARVGLIGTTGNLNFSFHLCCQFLDNILVGILITKVLTVRLFSFLWRHSIEVPPELGNYFLSSLRV